MRYWGRVRERERDGKTGRGIEKSEEGMRENESESKRVSAMSEIERKGERGGVCVCVCVCVCVQSKNEECKIARHLHSS